MGTWWRRRMLFQSILPSVEIPYSDLRHRVAQHMRDNEEYMEDISASVIWSVHVAFMSKTMHKLLLDTSGFISRHLLILGADAALTNFTTTVAPVVVVLLLLPRPRPPLMHRQLLHYSLLPLLRP